MKVMSLSEKAVELRLIVVRMNRFMFLYTNLCLIAVIYIPTHISKYDESTLSKACVNN